ncbi:MAG: carboxypeptidase-like regulatory domain-containing protein, partial [Tannerella sp.]|nr:carboxypeptidase-like regulatory domain-containing protein [Tannerella sp.]
MNKIRNKNRTILRKILLIVWICTSTVVLFAQTGQKITGIISDVNGEPIIGANIIEKGTTNGAISDMDGKFNLQVFSGSTVVITYVGFQQQEIHITNQTSLTITLEENQQNLDEVVVVGYGSTSKRNLTTSVSTVDASKMKNLPVASITDALAGRASGLIVTQSGGGINKKSTISIRGGGTPMVVIDGFVSPY